MLLELFNSFILQSTTVTWKGIRSKREKEKGKKKKGGVGDGNKSGKRRWLLHIMSCAICKLYPVARKSVSG